MAPAGRRAAVLAAGCAVVLAVALTMSSSSAASEPSVESMYHMWLGPNGLPLSPRKQRGLLFQFCTTNFVTEAEMRYCYARLLSVGNPSGPVKFSGQPQYDSEQVVSPLFTFSAPPMAGGEEEGGGEEAADAQVGGSTQLVMQPPPQHVSYRKHWSNAIPPPPQPAAPVARAKPAPRASAPAALAPQAAPQQQLPAQPPAVAPTAIVQPEPEGGVRIINPVKLSGAAKASPQSEWQAFEAVQKAGKEEWLAAQRRARAMKAQVHAAAAAKQSGVLPRMDALPKMKAKTPAELAQAGPWYSKQSALAI